MGSFVTRCKSRTGNAKATIEVGVESHLSETASVQTHLKAVRTVYVQESTKGRSKEGVGVDVTTGVGTGRQRIDQTGAIVRSSKQKSPSRMRESTDQAVMDAR